MDWKDFKNLRSGFTFLEAFFSAQPSRMQPSVWNLKQFLEINEPGQYPPISSVHVDYGFMNCQTFDETCILMEIYKRLLLKASPFDLQKACLAGNLFEFARKYRTMHEDHRRLMKNFYPLTNRSELGPPILDSLWGVVKAALGMLNISYE
jgi:hypothetical protein